MKRNTSWRMLVAAVFLFLLVPWVARADWEQVGEAGFSYSTSLTLDSSDRPYVAAYTDVANGYKASVMRFNGTAWEQVGQAGFSGWASNVYLALDSSGKPYVAYMDWANGDKASVMRFNGTAWEQVGKAGFSADEAWRTHIALDSSDRPYVAYLDEANGYKASVMRFNGTSWEQVGQAGFSADGGAGAISLALDSSDRPYVAYTYCDNSGYKSSVMRFNGTSWEQVGQAGFSAGVAFDYISLALDSSDKPYVAYMDWGNDGKVSVMRFNGTAWEQVGMAGFSAGWASNLSLALDSSGKPYVAYMDWSNDGNGKASVMRFNGASWEQVGKAGFSASWAGFISLALDSNDTPYVAYNDSDPDSANEGKTSVMKFVAAVIPPPDELLKEAMAAVKTLPPAAFKNSNMQHGFVNQINTAILRVKRGKYASALHLVRGGILVKTDGCAASGKPDKNDWLKDCADQANVYQLLQEAIECLESMI